VASRTPAEPRAAAARPLRADARRNRARILEAAEAVFAAKGVAASTEEVARRAGVGIGTVFRHFPTKEALLEAVVDGHLRRLADEAGALAAADDPGAALAAFFGRAMERSPAKLALVDALAAAGVEVGRRAGSPAGRELHRALAALLARAQRAGAVRDDVGVGDLVALLAGVSRAAEHAGWDRAAQARILAVVLDGLRHGGGTQRGANRPGGTQRRARRGGA
jgi:AcrR family transcriptional regulator